MNLHFGISFSGKTTDLKNLLSTLEKSPLTCLDISGACLSYDFFLKNSSNFIYSIDDLISPMDARNILNQKEKLRRQFLFEFEKKLDSMTKTFAKFASIDLRVEECVGDMFYYEDSIRLLKKLAIILDRHNMKLCVPMRVPSAVKNADTLFYRKLLLDSMLPNICLAFEIYPHELMSREKIHAAFLENRFDTGIIRVKYDTNSGNIISQTIFSCIKSALLEIPRSTPCFFDPMKYEYALMRREIKHISDLISCVQHGHLI